MIDALIAGKICAADEPAAYELVPCVVFESDSRA